MNILITGATSMIGNALCHELIEQGHDVWAIVRDGCRKEGTLPNSPRLELIYCDMSMYSILADKVKGTVDVGILLAWNGTRGTDRNNIQMQRENLEDNMAAVRSLQKMGCKKILSAGSQAEYGPWYEQNKQDENCVPCPNTEYGRYKLKFYKAAKKYCAENGIQFIEPRFFSLYGPDDYQGTLVMSTLKKLLQNQECEMTECKQMWDFLYITDAIEALSILIEKECTQGIYNLGYGDSQPLKYYVEKMHQITKSRSQLHYGAIPYPETGMVSINPSVEKLKKTGWKPQVSFEDGIQRIIDQHLEWKK